jgi:hypothetical protein
MGNRAVIVMKEQENENVFDKAGIYLHWNGGSESIRNFLLYAKMQEMNNYSDYAMARLTQVISNFFGGTLSIGIGVVKNLDYKNWDNGLYVIDNKFNIIEHISFIEHEDNPLWDSLSDDPMKLLEAGLMEKQTLPIHPYNMVEDMDYLTSINDSQPKGYRLNVRTMKKMYKELTAKK